MSLEYAVEDEPLGTGGAIGFAGRELDGSFFALNGDSLREADLGELVAFHRSTGAKATILLTPVADPSRYGLVRTAADGRVETFLEKPRPEEIDTDLINAGLYVLEPEVLDLVPPGRAVSIEREVFPRLAAEGSVYGIALPGLLARRRHARVLPPGAPRRARAHLPDGGRRRARRRLHARRRDCGRASRAPSSFRPCTSARAPSSRTARASGASPCSARARGSPRAASSRTPSSARGRRVGARRERRRLDRRRRRRARRGLRAAQPRGRRAGRGGRRRQRARPRAARRCGPAHPRRGAALLVSRYATIAAQGREAVGLGARLGRGGGLRRQAPLRSRRRVAEPPVPRGQGRVVARPGGSRAARAR